jgi:protein TonB
MASRRNPRALAVALAASLALHGIAFGALAHVASRLPGPGAPGKPASPGFFVRLLPGDTSTHATPPAATRPDPRPAEAAAAVAAPPPTRPPAARAAPLPIAATRGGAPMALEGSAPPPASDDAEGSADASSESGRVAAAAPLPAGDREASPPASAAASLDLPSSGGGPRAAGFDRHARPASSIRPRYPWRARQRGEEADVVVEAWVGPAGEVGDVQVVASAGEEFDAAALAAVRRAQFHPARRGGEAVASRVALRLHFRLDP